MSINNLFLITEFPLSFGVVFNDTDCSVLDNSLAYVYIPYSRNEVFIIENKYSRFVYYLGESKIIYYPSIDVPIVEEITEIEVKEPVKEMVKEVKVVKEVKKELKEVKVVKELMDYKNPKILKMDKNLTKTICERKLISDFVYDAVNSCRLGEYCECNYPLCTRLHDDIYDEDIDEFSKYGKKTSKEEKRKVLYVFMKRRVDPDIECLNLNKILDECLKINSFAPLLYPATKGCSGCENCNLYEKNTHPFTYCSGNKCKKSMCSYRHKLHKIT